MNRSGTWALSPAYDITYAYDPAGLWTRQHQMSVNGKRDGFTMEDFLNVGRNMHIKNVKSIVEEIKKHMLNWPDYAGDAGLPGGIIEKIQSTHRTDI